MTGKRRDTSTIRKAVALHAKGGLSVRQVAKEVKTHHATVARWIAQPGKYLGDAPAKKLKVPSNPPRADAPPVGDDGPSLEYTPPPKLIGEKGEKEATTCANCKAVLDDLGQPKWCPGCGWRLEWGS